MQRSNSPTTCHGIAQEPYQTVRDRLDTRGDASPLVAESATGVSTSLEGAALKINNKSAGTPGPRVCRVICVQHCCDVSGMCVWLFSYGVKPFNRPDCGGIVSSRTPADGGERPHHQAHAARAEDRRPGVTPVRVGPPLLLQEHNPVPVYYT